MGYWLAFIILLLLLFLVYVVIGSARVLFLSPEERQKRIDELRAKQAKLLTEKRAGNTKLPECGVELKVQIQHDTDSSDEEDTYLYSRDVAPTPWEKRTIYQDDAGNRYFVVWTGHGPQTEFSINRKERVKGSPCKLMKGFDGSMYISVRTESDGEKTYCYDIVSSQFKSVGHAPGKLLNWASRVLSFDPIILDALPFDYSSINLNLLWNGSPIVPNITFTYRYGDTRERLTVTPLRVYQHMISGQHVLEAIPVGLQDEQRFMFSNIETMFSTDGEKKRHSQEWLTWLMSSERV